MRIRKFAWAIAFICGLRVLHAAPDPNLRSDKKRETDAAAFKPVAIANELTQNDAKDPKLDNPAKTYNIRLNKDRTYVIDLTSSDFDSYLRLLDGKGNELAEDDDGGGGLNARLIFSASKNEEHQIVVTSFDANVGKFKLVVREVTLKGEAKPRTVGQDGLVINNQINQNDVSDTGKRGKTYSLQLKSGQTYSINLESRALDSYLYLFDGKSKLLAQDDDSGGDLNARIVFRAERDGVYQILATSLGGEDTGEITLTVRNKN